MYIWNSNGDLMWNFNSGASSLGIQDLAVTSAKIGTAQITSAHIQNAAIMNAHIGNLEVDNAKIANLTVGTGKIQADAVTESLAFSSITAATVTVAEVVVASLTFPALAPGDQVLLWASASGAADAAGTNALAIRLREDTLTGTELGYAILGNAMAAPVFAQAVYTAGGALASKVFVFTAENTTGTSVVTVHHIKFTGLRRKK